MPNEEFKTPPLSFPALTVFDSISKETLPPPTPIKTDSRPSFVDLAEIIPISESANDQSQKTALEKRIKFFAPKRDRFPADQPILTLTKNQGSDVMFPRPETSPVVPPTPPEPSYRKPAIFRALTMNVGALPKIFRDVSGSSAADPNKAFPAIRRHIDPSLYDFVGIQEVFSDYALLSDRDFAYREGPTKARGNFLGDGLVQFSGLPLTQLNRSKWSSCSGGFSDGSDCLASKGFSVSIIKIGDYEAYVYTAHFDAGTTLSDHEARKKQMYQLVDDIETRTNKRDLPVFIMGDLNLNLIPPSEQKARANEVDDSDIYRFLRNSAHFKDAFNAPNKPSGDKYKKITFGLDRILYRETKDVKINVESWGVPPELAAHQSEKDHAPITAKFTLSDANAPIDTVLRRRPDAVIAELIPTL